MWKWPPVTNPVVWCLVGGDGGNTQRLSALQGHMTVMGQHNDWLRFHSHKWAAGFCWMEVELTQRRWKALSALFVRTAAPPAFTLFPIPLLLKCPVQAITALQSIHGVLLYGSRLKSFVYFQFIRQGGKTTLDLHVDKENKQEKSWRFRNR